MILNNLIIGEEYSIEEDGKEFIRGKLTEIYTGRVGTKDNQVDTTGVVLDNGNGFLIDSSREIKKLI